MIPAQEIFSDKLILKTSRVKEMTNKPQKKMPSRAEISITGCYIALYKELYYYGNRYDLDRLYYR
jgi:hypothetical protein